MDSKTNSDKTNTVLCLYALLDRIANEEYAWDGMNVENEIVAFKEKLRNLKTECKSDLKVFENVLTRREVLKGAVAQQHRQDGTGEGNRKFDGCADVKINDETLIHKAITLLPPLQNSNSEAQMKFEEPKEELTTDDKEIMIAHVVCHIGTLCPFLLTHDKNGQTPLHLAVTKQRINLVKAIVRKLGKEKEKEREKEKEPVIEKVAKSPTFRRTAMMAGTPLCVSALTFNKDIFSYLIKIKANICGVNDQNENVCHSLVKYAYCHREKTDEILEMMNFIVQCEWEKIFDSTATAKARDVKERDISSMTNDSNDSTAMTKEQAEKEKARKAKARKAKEKARAEARELLTMTNESNLTPLQSAAKFGLHEVFNHIIHYEAYCLKDERDGLVDIQTYDITEIETEPALKIEPTQERNESTVKKDKDDKLLDGEKETHRFSILHAVLHQPPTLSFQFSQITPVDAVIKGKWHTYKKWFWSWGFIHFVFMVFLTWSAIERSRLDNENENESKSDPPKYKNVVLSDALVTIMGAFSLVYGLLFGLLQITSFKRYHTNLEWHFSLIRNPYNNLIYRLLLLVFCILLVIDFCFAAAQYNEPENICLILALIIGSYLLLFFLQAIKMFSFFTALIYFVSMEMLKFAIFMTILLFAFSSAMFMIMQGADTVDKSSLEFPNITIQMLLIMVGLGDIDLFQARHPGYAIGVFVLFILLTTILLLNALIAMMSNTCTDLMSKKGHVSAREMYYSIQRLSIVLFMESVLPKCFFTVVGDVEKNNRFLKDQMATKRLFWSNKTINSNDDKKDLDKHGLENHHYDYIVDLMKKYLPTKSTDVQPKRQKPNKNKTLPIDSQLFAWTLDKRHDLNVKNIYCKKCTHCDQEMVIDENITEFENDAPPN